MKIGIVHDTAAPGLGGHGTQFAFHGLPGTEIVALVDSRDEDVDRRMAEIGAQRRYRTCREMFDRETPDIVALASRLPGDHIEPIREAARRRCHVFCEKPLTADLAEADEIVRLSGGAGIKIAVAHLARHSLTFRTMKRMIAEGAIGRPLTFYGRGKEDGRGGGEDMMVLGTHILDIGVFLFGAPAGVYAEISVEGRPLRPTDRAKTQEPIGPAAGDDVYALYQFPNGVRGVFESRRGLLTSQARMGVTVAGTEGCLAARYEKGPRRLRISRSPYPPEDEARFEEVPLGEDVEIPGAAPLADLPFLPYFLVNNRLAAWDLVRAVREDREPAASAADARLTLEMIFGAYRSQLEGGWIALPLANRGHPLGKAG